MSISAADVNKLRQMTGAGLMDCKKALTETNGDFELAIDFLRKKGAKISANRADRNATEGAVIALTNAEATKGAVIVLSCETDFASGKHTLGASLSVCNRSPLRLRCFSPFLRVMTRSYFGYRQAGDGIRPGWSSLLTPRRERSDRIDRGKTAIGQTSAYRIGTCRQRSRRECSASFPHAECNRE